MTLIQQAMQERNPTTSLGALKEAEKVVAQDAPRIFLYHLGVTRIVKPYIRGLVVTPWDTTGADSFKQVAVLKH